MLEDRGKIFTDYKTEYNTNMDGQLDAIASWLGEKVLNSILESFFFTGMSVGMRQQRELNDRLDGLAKEE